MNPPADPIAAVVHPDPYPYYADLVAKSPLYRDEKLGMWVASSAAAVDAVLNNPHGRVRPPSELVPAAIRGGPAGELFGNLVRQNDGSRHGSIKSVVSMRFTALDPDTIGRSAQEWANTLAEGASPFTDAGRVDDFARRLPVCVVAGLLGFHKESALSLVDLTADLVRCYAPGASPERIAKGHDAATAMLAAMRNNPAHAGHAPLLSLGNQSRSGGPPEHALPEDLRLANSVGLLIQAYEATAGLIGNTLLVLATHPDWLDRARADPTVTASIVLEVARYDSPVQNTRRFFGRDVEILGQNIPGGQVVLAVLAAANRDPSANPNPDRFDPGRRFRRIYTFGTGIHACPGKVLALSIAQAGIARLLASGLDVERTVTGHGYRHSLNGRIPVFAGTDAA